MQQDILAPQQKPPLAGRDGELGLKADGRLSGSNGEMGPIPVKLR